MTPLTSSNEPRITQFGTYVHIDVLNRPAGYNVTGHFRLAVIFLNGRKCRLRRLCVEFLENDYARITKFCMLIVDDRPYTHAGYDVTISFWTAAKFN